MVEREKQTSKQKAILYLYEWIRALNAKPSLQLVEKSLIETWSSYLERINKLVMRNNKIYITNKEKPLITLNYTHSFKRSLHQSRSFFSTLKDFAVSSVIGSCMTSWTLTWRKQCIKYLLSNTPDRPVPGQLVKKGGKRNSMAGLNRSDQPITPLN